MERKDSAEFVFFYGTLLPPFVEKRSAMLLRGLHFHGDGSVRGVLYDLGEYPGAVFDATTDMRVDGTVFALPEDPQVLEALDRYEGYESTPILRTCSFVGSSASTSRLTTQLNAGPTNTMGTRTVRLVIASGRQEPQVSRPQEGRARNYELI